MSNKLFSQAIAFVSALLLLLIGLPLAVIVWRATAGEPLTIWRDPAVWQAIRLSLITSVISEVCLIVLGTPLAFWQSRRRRSLTTTITDLPIVLPPSVAGLGLLLVFGRNTPIGALLDQFGITIPFTTIAVILAQLFVATPFYVRAVRVGFQNIEPSMEEAAVVNGATQWQLLRYVLLPLNRTAIASGIILSWARALGEFGATLMFAGNLPNRTQTMPIAIFIGLERNLGSAIALAALLLILSSIILWLLRRLESG